MPIPDKEERLRRAAGARQTIELREKYALPSVDQLERRRRRRNDALKESDVVQQPESGAGQSDEPALIDPTHRLD